MFTAYLNRAISFIFLLFLFSSCASILNSKFQKVTIAHPEESKVLVDGYTPETKKGKVLFRRDGESKQITVLKEGYKDENLVIIQNHKSPLYILSIVPFSAALFIPPFYDNLLKSRDYVSEVELPRSLTPLPDKSKFSNKIYFSPIDFKLSSDSLKTTDFILYNEYIKGNHESEKEVIGDEVEMNKLKLLKPNALLIQSLEDKKYSYSNSKEIEITANISRIKKEYINSYRNQTWTTYSSFGQMLVTQLGIEWTIKIQGDQVFHYYTYTKSGEFASGYADSTILAADNNSIADAVEYGFIEFINLPQVQKIFENPDHEQITSPEIPASENLVSENPIEDTLSNLIRIENNDGNIYLIKKDKRLRINKEIGIGNFDKNIILEFINDQPELYAFAEINFHKGLGFISSLISCYNDIVFNPKETLDQSYYYQFGLITKKEWKNGPSAEILKEKRFISGEIIQLIIVTQNYENLMPTTSTTADNFKLTFSYGNAEYKSGFMMKNLKTAFQEDEEAIKYIKKYRAKKIRRYCFGGAGVALIGFAIYLASGGEAVGLDEKASPFVAVPGVVLASTFMSLDRSYKTELISKAINTYNQNLQNSTK